MPEADVIQPGFRYIKNFDGLRGVAVLLVLLYHGSYGFCEGGWIGVDLFFIMSGYLITSLLRNEYLLTRNISFTRFYIRRVLRLFPALAVCLVLANVLWPLTRSLTSPANELLATLGGLFYFTNILNGSLTGNLSHLWSLSVEEHFYFFWPIACYAIFFVISGTRRLVVLLATIIAVILFRLYVAHHQGSFDYGIISLHSNRFTLCKIDELILGSMLVFLPLKETAVSRILQQFGTLVTVLLSVIFLIVLFTVDEHNPSWLSGGFLLTNALCLFTVYITILIPDSFLFSNQVFVWLGKRSYGIYLYHVPLFLYLNNFREAGDKENFLLISFVRFFLTIAIAAISYQYIEKPVLKYKAKFEVQKIV